MDFAVTTVAGLVAWAGAGATGFLTAAAAALAGTAAALDTDAVALDATWVAGATGLVADEVWTALVRAWAVAAGFATVDGFFAASAAACAVVGACATAAGLATAFVEAVCAACVGDRGGGSGRSVQSRGGGGHRLRHCRRGGQCAHQQQGAESEGEGASHRVGEWSGGGWWRVVCVVRWFRRKTLRSSRRAK